MRKHPFEPLDMLRRLGNEYRHVEQEHHREPPYRRAIRHRLEDQMRELEAHFDRLLVQWTTDEALRLKWREFLRARGPAPDEPRLALPPLFKGRTDAGAVVEIRPVSDGYDVVVDGARTDHTHVPWHLDPDRRGPVQIGEHACEEMFDAPGDAIAALTEFLAGRDEPPWRWARDLFEDGLIDPELALTPRGRRCLERERPAAQPPAPGARNYCVLVADAARARVLVLAVNRERLGVPTSVLVEVADLTNPMLRARDVEAVSDTRMGRRGGAHTPLRGTDDHRAHRRRDIERHFAALAAEDAAGVWRRYPSCDLIIVASPVMLGLLRPAIARLIRAKDQINIHELARDLTKLSTAMLHDLLAEADLLPERGRREPLTPTPGLPI